MLKQDWDRQSGTQIVTELCGFVTILSGTFLLHKTKDMVDSEFKESKHSLFLDLFAGYGNFKLYSEIDN